MLPLYLRLHVIINHLWLLLDIFAITSYVWSYLQLHYNYFGFHFKRTTYVPLVANATNLIKQPYEYTKMYFVHFKEYICIY